MVLLFNARGVMTIEKELGCSILESISILSTLPLDKLGLFVKVGMGLDDIEKAYDEMSRYFVEEKKDTLDLLNLILESLQGSGFLSRKFPMEQMKQMQEAEMKKALDEMLVGSSAMNGEMEKDTPSELE
jgi:hypothetical protein